MLIDYFYTLRSAKLPVSVKEFLTLLEALKEGVVGPNAPEPGSEAEPSGYKPKFWPLVVILPALYRF